MDERKLQKQLIRITAITIISSIVLCLLGLAVLGYVLQAAHESDHVQMQIETKEYKERIFKQMDKNMQVLTILSRVFEAADITQSKEILANCISKANRSNDFISMVYMKKDGFGVMNTPGFGTWEDFSLQDCHPYAIDAIEKAMNGENAVSKMFNSDVYYGKLFVYAVPVYRNDEIIGVLAASDTMEIFTDIANGSAVMGGEGYVHLINAKGEFLVRSKNAIVKEPVETLFEGPYLSSESKTNTQEALANGESVIGEFVYDGKKYHYYLEPMGLNEWFLFCADSIWGSVDLLSNVLIISGVVLLLILIVVNVLLYSGYYQFRKTSKALMHLAYWDTVTGAENTVRFDQNFQQVLEEGKDFSTVAINIHNFKGINDLFGKARGDMVLCYLKDVIGNNLNEGEFFCRDTADLFYILMLEADEEKVCQRTKAIIDYISQTSMDYGEYGYELALYSGIAIKGDREKALLALQSIEHTHQVDIAVYNSKMHDEVRRKNSIESQMYPALQNKEFKLFLQPKFNLKTDELVGAEALVRWQNPDGSYRYPGEFIPLFEKNGFCLNLDMYMFEQVCQQLKEWLDSGIKPIPISINQSKILFSNLKYPDYITQITEKYNVSPRLITLEVLEGVATDNLQQLNALLDELHAKGFKISMDDFGSGYSSLNMVYQLAIDELKLDRGFLSKSTQENEQRRQIILEQIISFAKKLGISIVAEGIETEEDKENMLSLDCEYGQGYFYAKPMSVQDFTERYMKERQ